MAKPFARKWAVILTVLATALIAVPTAVWASHRFTDVPDSHTFHNAIDWLADNGITVGCNPPANDQFCPSESVTRGQMAAFMKRLAENEVVNAKTGGTAFEAANDPAVILTGTTAGSADSIATLSGLEAGTYVATATWTGRAETAAAGGRIVCDLSVGSASARASAIVSDTAGFAGEDSMSAVVAGTLGANEVVNLSCWREGGTGDLSIVRTNLVANPMSGVQSINVSS